MSSIFTIITLVLVCLIFESTLVWGAIEFWKMEYKFPAIIFFLTFVVTTSYFGYLFIGGLNK